jgi:hypothetical protein
MPNPQQLTLESMLDVLQPAEALISPDSCGLATVVAGGFATEFGRSPAVLLSPGNVCGPLRQITQLNGVEMPQWPDRKGLAMASYREHSGRTSHYDVQPGSSQVTRLADVAGTRQIADLFTAVQASRGFCPSDVPQRRGVLHYSSESATHVDTIIGGLASHAGQR